MYEKIKAYLMDMYGNGFHVCELCDFKTKVCKEHAKHLLSFEHFMVYFFHTIPPHNFSVDEIDEYVNKPKDKRYEEIDKVITNHLKVISEHTKYLSKFMKL